VIPAADSLDDLMSAPDARCNLVIDPRALPLAVRMKAKFETPYVYAPRAFDLDGVARWYDHIGAALEIDFAPELEAMRDRAGSEMHRYWKKLAGRRFALRGVSARPFAVARFLVAVGMQPEFIHVGTILEQDEADIRYIIEQGFDPFLIAGENSVEIDRLLFSLLPDYFIAINHRDVQPAARWGIHTCNLEPASSRLGFECSLEVARILAAAESELDIVYYKNAFLNRAWGR
jgi:nitrogenase molybdenum-cofactor synthesis protein NifE